MGRIDGCAGRLGYGRYTTDVIRVLVGNQNGIDVSNIETELIEATESKRRNMRMRDMLYEM